MEKKKHPHTGHRQRLKDKALKGGIQYWPPHEVLELLLTYSIPQKDVNPLAHDLIDTFGSLSNVFDADYEQLKTVNGIGDGTALFLSLMPAIFNKYEEAKNSQGIILNSPQKCLAHFKKLAKEDGLEEFFIFCMDNKKKLLKTVKLDGGKVASFKFSITTFARSIASDNYKSIIVMHNHPNGNPNPSKADRDATKRLIETGKSVGVEIEDHIIVGDNEYYSFLRSGLLGQLKAEAEGSGWEFMESFKEINFIEESKKLKDWE